MCVTRNEAILSVLLYSFITKKAYIIVKKEAKGKREIQIIYNKKKNPQSIYTNLKGVILLFSETCLPMSVHFLTLSYHLLSMVGQGAPHVCHIGILALSFISQSLRGASCHVHTNNVQIICKFDRIIYFLSVMSIKKYYLNSFIIKWTKQLEYKLDKIG